MGMIMQWAAVRVDEIDSVRGMDTDALMDWLEDGDTDRLSFDVDKAWNAVHFVLTDDPFPTDHPLSRVVFGDGDEFGGDLGLGPARLLRPNAVREIADLLAEVQLDDFNARVDLDALSSGELYPAVWNHPAELDSNRQYLAEGFTTIKNGFLAAAKDGCGFVVTLM